MKKTKSSFNNFSYSIVVSTILVKIENGRVSREQDFFDYASLMSQLMQNSGEVNLSYQIYN